MSAEEVDEYLRSIEEPKRTTLQALRRTIREVLPEAEQVISYRGQRDDPASELKRGHPAMTILAAVPAQLPYSGFLSCRNGRGGADRRVVPLPLTAG